MSAVDSDFVNDIVNGASRNAMKTIVELQDCLNELQSDVLNRVTQTPQWTMWNDSIALAKEGPSNDAQSSSSWIDRCGATSKEQLDSAEFRGDEFSVLSMSVDLPCVNVGNGQCTEATSPGSFRRVPFRDSSSRLQRRVELLSRLNDAIQDAACVGERFEISRSVVATSFATAALKLR